MASPRICAAITSNDSDAVKKVTPLTDLFEVRIDLIGPGWQEVAVNLAKPWIACNRKKDEGGAWDGSESARLEEFLKAIDIGAAIVDIEMSTLDVSDFVKKIKGKAEILLSYHNMEGTPSLDDLKDILEKQIDAGADICKVVTTACKTADNITVIQLIKEYPDTRVVSFAMGPIGQVSRILSPLVGGYFTYASIEEGKESASGQLTVEELREIYRILGEVENA